MLPTFPAFLESPFRQPRLVIGQAFAFDSSRVPHALHPIPTTSRLSRKHPALQRMSGIPASLSDNILFSLTSAITALSEYLCSTTPTRCNKQPFLLHFLCYSVSLLLWDTLFLFPVADVSLIHHQNPCRFGKQPKHSRKITVFAPFFVDGIAAFAVSSRICCATPHLGAKNAVSSRGYCAKTPFGVQYKF